MDLGQRILLLTSLGQIKQIRAWLPVMDLPLPPDIGLVRMKRDEGDLLSLTQLERDLYSRLSQFVDFLKRANLLDNPLLMFEADYESNIIFPNKSTNFSIMLTPEGQIILTYISSGSELEFEQILTEEWEKRIEVFD